jgi:hypothetical protein
MVERCVVARITMRRVGRLADTEQKQSSCQLPPLMLKRSIKHLSDG